MAIFLRSSQEQSLVHRFHRRLVCMKRLGMIIDISKFKHDFVAATAKYAVKELLIKTPFNGSRCVTIVTHQLIFIFNYSQN
jgi:predicted transcriptional regulator